MKYWVYKMTYDTSAAPHVRDGVLSLAICKPRIREDAAEGDIIFGISGRSRRVNRGERLIYVAEVTKKLTRSGEYYESAKYRGRWDCIYDRVGEKLVWRPGSLFHKDDPVALRRDIGPAPLYPRAIALLSDDFRYLGDEGTSEFARRWPDLGSFVYEIGIMEQDVEPESKIGRMLTELKREIWRSRRAGDVGPPTEPELSAPNWTKSEPSSGNGASRRSCGGGAETPVGCAPPRLRPGRPRRGCGDQR
jgi:hypothetical protein